MAISSIADTNSTAAPVAYPPAPEDRVLYVIGDIHGRRDLLERVFEAIDRDKARRRDRGQDLARPQDAGRLGASGDVRIDQIRAHVRADRVVVGEAAGVEGSLAARDVVISGNTRGSVGCDNLALRPTSHDKARLHHNSLAVEQGCQFEGSSRHLDDRPATSDRDGLSPSPAVLEIYLGDYIDRGEDSRGVVDALIERGEHVEAVFLRGNHEQFLLDFLVGRLDPSMWKQLGATATLRSYGVHMGQLSFLASRDTLRHALDEALPEDHARFFADTVPYFVTGPYLFVHAGLRPGIPLQQQQPADLMGIRRQFLEFEGDFGHIVVHGHTPVTDPEFKHNRINLDTGAYSTGRLSCLRIDRNGPELLEA